MVSCSEDDLRLLILKGFLIPFESGIIVITDWKVNNPMRADRYHETRHIAEKEFLTEKNRTSLKKA